MRESGLSNPREAQPPARAMRRRPIAATVPGRPPALITCFLRVEESGRSGGGEPGRAAHARAAAAAVAPWVLGEVLLVVVLGVVELGRGADLRRDGLVAGLAEHALVGVA